MSVIEYLPAEAQQYFQGLDADIYSQIHDFARNNNAYRNGEIDEIAIRFVGVRPDKRLLDRNDYDKVSYEFSAERIRDSDVDQRGRVYVTAYAFGLIAMKHNVDLPPTISVDPVEIKGPFSLMRQMVFSINSDTKTLKICDSFTYLSNTLDEISFMCACEELEEMDSVHTAPHKSDLEDDEVEQGNADGIDVEQHIERAIQELEDENRIAASLLMEEDLGIEHFEQLVQERTLAYRVMIGMVKAVRSQFRQ